MSPNSIDTCPPVQRFVNADTAVQNARSPAWLGDRGLAFLLRFPYKRLFSSTRFVPGASLEAQVGKQIVITAGPSPLLTPVFLQREWEVRGFLLLQFVRGRVRQRDLLHVAAVVSAARCPIAPP